ncbi:MAG TPA: SRPBCC domain-containing protein [Solirubrobacteraceae bacterium]|nr:SRPBCC domain-containing protein [Solirubrobacteraceae bacterium]
MSTLQMERTFAAPAQRVFDAFTSEEVIRRWWHPDPDWDTPEVLVDLRIGGTVRVVMRDPQADVRYGGGGEYVEIDPPHRLAFTWTWDDDREHVRQLIEIDFKETYGVTTMRFTHNDLWDEDAVASHEEGWTGAFDNLAGVVEG